MARIDPMPSEAPSRSAPTGAPLEISKLEPPRASRRHRREQATPSTTLVVFDGVLIALFLALTFLLGVFPLRDTDFWWHLRTGDLIRQTGQVPWTDWYTFTASDHRWIDTHWLFEVLLSWGYQLGGVVALNLLKCVVTCLSLGLLVTTRRREWPVWVMLLAWLPALFVLSGRMYVRPETITLFWLACDLAILSRWDRTPWLGFLVPVVQVFWVNTQGLFVLGPIILSFAVIDAALAPGALAASRRRWWKMALAVCALTALACLVNPYHIRGALFPIELTRTMSDRIFSETIAELMPVATFIQQMGFQNLPLSLHLFTIVLGALSFLVPGVWSLLRSRQTPASLRVEKASPKSKSGRSRKGVVREVEKAAPPLRLRPFRLLLFLAFSLISLKATRNTHQFAAVVGAVTAWNLGEWAAALRRSHPSITSHAQSLAEVRSWVVTASVLIAALLFVGSGTFYSLAGEGRTIGLGEEPLWYPHAAVAAAGGPGTPERFVCIHNGHSALYEYAYGPERKTYADARLEVLGPEVYSRYLGLDRSIHLNLRDRAELERYLESPEGRRDTLRDQLVAWPEALESMGRPGVLVDLLQPGNADTAASLMDHPSWRCIWFDAIACVFVHESFSAAKTPIDFLGLHFTPGRPGSVPSTSAAEALAQAKALSSVALALVQRGRLDRARPLILLALDRGRIAQSLDPESVGPWKIIGLLEAISDSIEAPRYRMPFDPVFDLGPASATYALRHAIQLAPDDSKSLYLLAGSYRMRGMYEEALPLFQRLAVLDPPTQRRDVALQVRQEAIDAAARCLVELGTPPATTWKNHDDLDRLFRENLERGRAESAATLLETAYPADEGRPWEVADRLATLWMHLGRPINARTAWRSALRQTRLALVEARVAASFLIEHDFMSARRHYTEALRLEPNLFEARYGLAMLELEAGRADAARDAAQGAVNLASSDVARNAARMILAMASPFARSPASERAQPSTPQDDPKPKFVFPKLH